jgi:LysR family transcriptional regulator, mexEF-oprN operon transcriptional activator
MVSDPVNLASTDLNLLVAFDALMAERSVTRAGQRIGLGQPGMSAALARLRATFGDELFVRIPGKPMRPTTRAIALHAPIAEILAGVSRVLDAGGTFDPATARANIRIATGDPAGTVVAPRLMGLLCKEAPGINIRLVVLDKRDAFDRLDRGDIDLVFSTFTRVPKRIRRERLFTDTYVCVVRRDASWAVRQSLDLETYVTTPHILATLAADDRGIVDEALARLGLRRRVAVTVPNIYLIPRLVAETGMISHLPRRIATEMLRGYDLVMFPPPVTLPEWDIDMYWGAASTSEPTTSWIRSRLSRIGQQIRLSENAPPA